MALIRLFDPTTQFQTKSGALNVAGKLRIYVESTDDLANIYGDDGSRLPQPLILDSNGRARGLFVDSGRSYRLEAYDRNDSLLFTIRRLEPNESGTIVNQTLFIKGTPDEIDVEDSVTEETRTYTVSLSAKVTGEIVKNREAIVKESEARNAADDELRKMIDNIVICDNDITIANGDKLVVTDSSDSNKIARASIAFDGSTTTKALTQKGTFEAFAKSGDITTAIQALDVSSVGGDGKYISSISETDGKISATAAKMDSTPMANSTKAVTSEGIKTALDGKASKVANATSGNFASLDANGNLTDSRHKHGDYALLNSTYGTRGFISGEGSNPDLLLEKLKLGVIQLYQGPGVGVKLYEYDAGNESNAVLVWDSSTLTGDALQKFLNGQKLGTIYTSTAGKCIKAEYNGHTADAYYYCRAFGIFMTPKHADKSHTATAVCKINGVTYASYKINTYSGLVTAVCPDVNYTTVIVNFTPSAATTRMRFYGFRCLNTYDGVNAVLLGRSTSALSATKATQDSDGNAINATYFKSSGNVTLVSGTATKIGTQNGTDVKITLPTIPAAANTASPLMDGKASVGNSLKYAREDHIHPTDSNKLNVDGSNATTAGVTAMMKKVESGNSDLTDDSYYFGDGRNDHTKIVRRPILNIWNYIAGKVQRQLLGSVGSEDKPIYLENGVPKVCADGVPYSSVSYEVGRGYGAFVGGAHNAVNSSRIYCTFLVSMSSFPDNICHTYIGTFTFRGGILNSELKCLTGTPAYPLRIATIYNEDGKDSNGKPTYTVGLYVIPADKTYKYSSYKLTRIASHIDFIWDVKSISEATYDELNSVAKPALKPIILTWDAKGSNVTTTGGTWIPSFDKATIIDCRGIVDMSIQVDLSIIGQRTYVDTLSSYKITLVNSSKTDILPNSLHQAGRMPRQTYSSSSTIDGTIDISCTHRFIFPITSTSNLLAGYRPKITLPSNYPLDSGAQVNINALCRGIVLPYGADEYF